MEEIIILIALLFAGILINGFSKDSSTDLGSILFWAGLLGLILILLL